MPYRLVPRGLLERLGRRGAVLLIIGLVWLIQGTLLFAEGPSNGLDPTASPHENLPFPVVPLIWALSGIVATVAGMRRGDRDHIGFVAASGPPLMLTGSHVVGGVTFFLPTEGGNAYGIPLALGWGVIVLLIGILASWPEVVEKDPDA